MKRVLALVEGQTEERFFKDVLQPHLWSHNVSIEPKIVLTKRVIGGVSHKGGGDFGKIAADARRLLSDSNAVAVTTFFDFYGFPRNVPNARPSDYGDIDALEAAIGQALSADRFRPYLQLHEFEAFLFIDADITATAARQPAAAKDLRAQADGFDDVEQINNHPETAPSKRVAKAVTAYSKPLLASAVTARLGIERIRAAAPRFANWLNWLENSASTQAAS